MKKQIFSEQIRRMQKLAGILKENYNPGPSDIARQIAGPFSSYIVPESTRYTYGPDGDGTYHLDFELAFNISPTESPTELEAELENQIGGSSYGGPGQAFSRTYVSYNGMEREQYVFSVTHRAGYDN